MLHIYTWIEDLFLKLYTAAKSSVFSVRMTLYTLYTQPSYGTNQTDLPTEITLVWFSKSGKLWWPFWRRKINTNLKKDNIFWQHFLYMMLYNCSSNSWAQCWRNSVFCIEIIRRNDFAAGSVGSFKRLSILRWAYSSAIVYICLPLK